jgi:hypothetical protein
MAVHIESVGNLILARLSQDSATRSPSADPDHAPDYDHQSL